jgi:hypothetical protein
MFKRLNVCSQRDLERLSECPMVRCNHRHSLRDILIEQPQKGLIFDAEIDRLDSFLRLELRYQSVTGAIASMSESLQLGQIIGRMHANRQDFRILANEQEDPTKREWFTRVADIIKNFSYADFGLIALEPAVAGLLKPDETHCYSIFEGQHRSLALAWRVVEDVKSFRPIRALLLFPRRTSTENR